jgi:hypothetical protein
LTDSLEEETGFFFEAILLSNKQGLIHCQVLKSEIEKSDFCNTLKVNKLLVFGKKQEIKRLFFMNNIPNFAVVEVCIFLIVSKLYEPFEPCRIVESLP